MSYKDYFLYILKDLIGVDTKSFIISEQKKIKNNTNFFIRVDDFPRAEYDLELYSKFHNILNSYVPSYVLGVTPFLRQNGFYDDEIIFLKENKNSILIALHGVTHTKKIKKKYSGEFATMSKIDVLNKLRYADNYIFNKIGYKPNIYVPPFNFFDRNAINIIFNRYKFVMGGSTSLIKLGKMSAYSQKQNGIFLPSIKPTYGKAKDMIKYNFTNLQSSKPLPIAIHWAWEVEDNFDNLKQFLQKMSTNLVGVPDEML